MAKKKLEVNNLEEFLDGVKVEGEDTTLQIDEQENQENKKTETMRKVSEELKKILESEATPTQEEIQQSIEELLKFSEIIEQMSEEELEEKVNNLLNKSVYIAMAKLLQVLASTNNERLILQISKVFMKLKFGNFEGSGTQIQIANVNPSLQGQGTGGGQLQLSGGQTLKGLILELRKSRGLPLPQEENSEGKEKQKNSSNTKNSDDDTIIID